MSAALLNDYAKANGVIASRPFYIVGEFSANLDGEDRYSNEAYLYCYECAEKLSEAAGGSSADHDFFGAYTDCEDSCCHCEICGALLDYHLSEAGVGAELAHYSTVRLKRALTPHDAWHIARVADAMPNDKRVARLLKRALAALSDSAGKGD